MGLQYQLERGITPALQELEESNGGLLLWDVRHQWKGSKHILQFLDVGAHVFKLREEVGEGPSSPVNIIVILEDGRIVNLGLFP